MIEPVIVGQLRAMGHVVFLTGSRAILEDVPLDRDYDYVVWLTGTPEENTKATIKIMEAGFELEGPKYDKEDRTPRSSSWGLGQINLIITVDADLARRFQKATALARRLKLQERDQRVALFKAVLYDNFPHYPMGLGWDITPDEVRHGD